MRKIEIDNDTLGISGMVVIPDHVVYAFNPNYIEISVEEGVAALQLSVSYGETKYTIEVALYQGSAKCYISKILQVLFDDYVATRSESVTLTVSTENDEALATADFLVVWGALELGKRYGYYLPFAYGRASEPRQERRVVWFKNFPFKVSLFRESNEHQMYAVYDSQNKIDIDTTDDDVGIIEYDVNTVCPSAKKELVFVVMRKDATSNAFDANFDIVFEELSQLAYIVRLTVCEDTAGIYLRWIDQYGFWQYYLFVKGERQSKNKMSSTEVDAEFSHNGVYYRASRYLTVENTDTITCCATNLPDEILAYVETIYKSPYIEMYIGKDFDGNELWQPVSLDAGTTKMAADLRLTDYEITLSMQQTPTQTL